MSAPHYDVDHAVTLRHWGLPPEAGLLIDISRTEAAIRVHGLAEPLPGPWPTRLRNGDEIQVSGLLNVPVSCWVIGVTDGVLRVHLFLDDALLHQLVARFPTLLHHDPA